MADENFERMERKRRLAYLKDATGWGPTELAERSGKGVETIKSFLKGTATLEYADALQMEPEAAHEFIVNNPEEAARLVAEKQGGDPVGHFERLQKYIKVAATSGKNTGFSGQLLAAKAPSEDVLEKLERDAVAFAWEIIGECAVVEIANPLSRGEFDVGVANEIDGRILVAESSGVDPDQVLISINGRKRRLADGEYEVPRLGHIHYVLSGNLADNRQAIMDAAWNRYADLVKAAEGYDVERKRELYRKLTRLLAISNADMARATGRTVDATRHWSVAGWTASPPDNVMEVLMLAALRWASDVVNRADGDKHFRIATVARPFMKEAYWRDIALKTPVNARRSIRPTD